MLLGDDKRTVVVLKDITMKQLLLILEYVYLGSVDLEPEDIDEFREAAKSLQIKVEFDVTDAEMLSQNTTKEFEVSSSSTLAMSCSRADMSIGTNYNDSMDAFEKPPLMISSISSLKTTTNGVGKRLMSDAARLKKADQGPLLKKLKLKPPSPKRRRPGQIKLSMPAKRVEIIAYCVHCNRRMRERDRTYHEKYCWDNLNRIESNCILCDRKFDVPSKLRKHNSEYHPGVLATPV